MGEKHSNIVGGSTAARRLGCPGSMALEATMPDSTSSYAQEGSELHLLMEDMFGDDSNGKASRYLGEQFNSIPAVTQEQVDALQWAYDIADPLVGENEFFLEVWADFPNIEGAGGTCDVVVLHDDDSLTLIDYKFGRGVPVTAEGNKQLMFYAAALRAHMGHEGRDIHTVRAHIIQPRLHSHTHDTFDTFQLDNFEKELIHAIETAREEYRIGPWCKFCKAESICPAKTKLAQDAYQWDMIAANDLARSLAVVDEVEAWAKAVRAAAFEALTAGTTIQGWKLVNKVARRKWALNSDVLHRRLQRAGLKIDQRAPRDFITPSQAEKLGVVLTEDMVDSSSSGTTMVRENDRRPAIDSGRRSLNDLAVSINANDGDKTNG